MIKNTKSNCIVSDIRISKSKAYITLIVSSSEYNNPVIPFNIYIKEYNIINEINNIQLNIINNLKGKSPGYYKTSTDNLYEDKKYLLTDTKYWLDKIDIYSDSTNNVNINLYKELVFEIDITNNNKSTIINNRFVRQICFEFIKADSTKETIWKSENILLLSEEIALPNIANLNIETTTEHKIRMKYKYEYESDADFNYNNEHLFTEIVVKSAQSNETLEVMNIEDEIQYDNGMLINLNNIYYDPIVIYITIKNYHGTDRVVDQWLTNQNDNGTYTEKLVYGDIMKTYEYNYTPRLKYSNMFIKINNIIYRVINSMNNNLTNNNIGFYPVIHSISLNTFINIYGINKLYLIKETNVVSEIYYDENQLSNQTNDILITLYDNIDLRSSENISIKMKKYLYNKLIATDQYNLFIDNKCCSEDDIARIVCSDELTCI